MYPDFIGIGAQKAGTTWLSRNLQLHPQIWMPPLKEIHYFDEKINDPRNTLLRVLEKLRGSRVVDEQWRKQVRTRCKRHLMGSGKDSLRWELTYYFGTPGDEWYASLFEPDREALVGEITPAYSILDRDVIAHVRELMPKAKIIFMMRNPIERAWSETVMQLDKQGQDIAAVEEERLRRSCDLEGSRLRTDYLRILENWGGFYPPEQIFVGFLEDIHYFPDLFLRRLYGFLGVEESTEHRMRARMRMQKRKIHSRAAERMPTRIAAYLASSYREKLEELHDCFGGYASFWLYCAERLVNDLSEEEFTPYPLWESAMWDEWASSSEAEQPQFQSGPLPAVRVA